MSTKMVERSGTLFDPQDTAPIEQTDLRPQDGPTLRVVWWPLVEDGKVVDGQFEERPCLVVCSGGERNVKTVRKLQTVCGMSCAGIAATSAMEPTHKEYCNACLAGAPVDGVLR